MKLNAVEKALMNNPVRAVLQRRYEATLLERIGGLVEGKRVLEIGCGRGVGTEIIFERFRAGEVHAFDLDPDMVAQAENRLTRYMPGLLKLYVGDAAGIHEPDASFDAVFDFAIIHHIPNWKDAVAEVARVLKPGGKFYFEEVTGHALGRWFYRAFLDHPQSQHWFNKEKFIGELERNGIEVKDNLVERIFGDFIFGVGRRSQSNNVES
jgi:ubiquinone/menaquinone biosynthesis C-methylase UbiE